MLLSQALQGNSRTAVVATSKSQSLWRGRVKILGTFRGTVTITLINLLFHFHPFPLFQSSLRDSVSQAVGFAGFHHADFGKRTKTLHMRHFEAVTCPVCLRGFDVILPRFGES